MQLFILMRYYQVILINKYAIIKELFHKIYITSIFYFKNINIYIGQRFMQRGKKEL